MSDKTKCIYIGDPMIDLLIPSCCYQDTDDDGNRVETMSVHIEDMGYWQFCPFCGHELELENAR